MSEEILEKSFQIVRDFGAELSKPKSAIENILFRGKFPESILPHSKETILGATNVIKLAVKGTQPEVEQVLEQTPAFLEGYIKDSEAKEIFKKRIKEIANSEEEIDNLFDLYISRN
jgi:hypothetical protein